MARIVLIDHYDSFTYNIVHALKMHEVMVFSPDGIDWGCLDLASHIILSPGFGHPRDARVSLEILKKYQGKKPILGICLGHQIIGHFFGSEIARLEAPCHGKEFVARHQGGVLFEGVPTSFRIGRYHSLYVKRLGEGLRGNCFSSDGILMGLEHESLPIFGLQFHPESILSEFCPEILRNFTNL